MSKNKITLRVSDEVFWRLKKEAEECNCTATKKAEQILGHALGPAQKTTEDCIMEVATNSAAAVQELARIILAESPDEYQRYQQSVTSRTSAGLQKFRKQISGSGK
jgi:hypothetical protein